MFKNVLIFISGAAIGGVGTWLGIKKYYENKADLEIQALSEYRQKVKNEEKKLSEKTDDISPEEKAKMSINKPDLTKYKEILGKQNYNAYSEKKKNVKKEEEASKKEPYIITPNENSVNNGYAKVQLDYYIEDGVLADGESEEVVDMASTIGTDAINHFGEYEEDVIHIRNDNNSTDYEVICQHTSYESIVGEGTYYDAEEEY